MSSLQQQEQQEQAGRLESLLSKLRSDFAEVERRLKRSELEKDIEVECLEKKEIEEISVQCSIENTRLQMRTTSRQCRDIKTSINKLRDKQYELEGERFEIEWACFYHACVLFRDFGPRGNTNISDDEKQTYAFRKAFYTIQKERVSMIRSTLQVARKYMRTVAIRRDRFRETKRELNHEIATLQHQAQCVRGSISKLEEKRARLDVVLQIETGKRDTALEKLSALEHTREDRLIE